MGEVDRKETELVAELERLRRRISELESGRVQPGGSHQSLLDFAADPIFIVCRESCRFLSCNRAAVERYGYSRDELFEMTIYDLHPKEQWAVVQRNVDDEGDGGPHSYTHVTKHGEQLQVEIHTEHFEFEEKPAWISVVRDTTDRIRADEALRQSEERYRNLVELSPEAILVLRDGKVAFINEAGARLLGGERPGDLLGSSVEAIVHPDYHELAKSRIQQVVKMGRVPAIESRFVRLDGECVPVEVAGARITFQGEPAVQVVARDITDRELIDDRVRVEKAYFERLFESAPQAIVIVDNDGRISRVNAEFVRLFGYSIEELVGRSVDDVIVPDELYAEAHSVTQGVAKGETISLETRRQRKDGTLVDVSILGAPVKTDQGQEAVYGIYTDITESKGLEQRLRQSHKMEAIGQLAGGVAHDFNNLLTAILGNCELLLNDLEPNDPHYMDVAEIKRAGDRAAALTRQLLAFSRRQYLQPKVLDLNTVVVDTEKMLRRLIGEDIDLLTNLDPSLRHVKADPGQIEQVIVNLAVNARDAMPSGGKLTITTQNVELDAAYTRTHHPLTPGHYVMLAVSDSGMGMDAETQSHIFEPFFTTKEKGKGTGLGLATVYGIIKQSDGFVWVESETGRGTTFRIHLPLVDQAADARRPGADPRDAPAGTETVLLVEDEDVVRGLLNRVLVERGYRVLDSRDADQALRLAAAHQGRIDLLVTDMVMPGKSGRELTKDLSESRRGLKVLYISGYMDALSPKEWLGAGSSFLQKPFSPDAFARKVREVLDGP